MAMDAVDVFIVVAPTPAIAASISSLLAPTVEALSSSPTADEVHQTALASHHACSWVLRRKPKDLAALLPVPPHAPDMALELEAAYERCHAMQMEFDQFQQDVHELQAQYLKYVPTPWLRRLGRRVCEANQRLLWEYIPAHDPTMASFPSVAHDVEENVHIIGKYMIQATIGEGQYASVFACCARVDPSLIADRQPSPPLAVKVIDKSKLTDATALQRVQMELTALTDPVLRHPSVLFLRDVIHTPKYLYLITDRGGKDLFEYIGPHENGISEATTTPLLFKIVDAIRHLHAHGYCHRDLKPENILYAPESAGVKVVDFGLCTKVSRGSSKKLGDFCGSPGFFAPEILLHETYDGFKADVWSLGCILLELVLGNSFFLSIWMAAYHLDVLGDRSLFRQTVHQNLAKMAEALRGPSMQLYSDAIKDLLLCMLVENPKERLSIADVYDHALFEPQRRQLKKPLVKSVSASPERKPADVGPRLMVQGHVHIHPMSHPPSPPRPRSEEHPPSGKVVLPAIGAKSSPEKPR
ncbi:protein kinase [Achlya hypogyna]|uniref:Protein kinase n=1 Tax=Achlya hypogyna TaxID=1202772 RepID=A0A1V9Y9P6_ACHHY|nr:protein kinase [Achlya hypogyna]